MDVLNFCFPRVDQTIKTTAGERFATQEIQPVLPMDIRVSAVRGLMLAAVVVSLPLSPARAEELPLANGRTLSGVTIMRVEPDGLVVRTATGIQTIPFTELAESLRALHGYDPAKAEAHLRALSAAEEARATAIAAQQESEVRVRRVREWAAENGEENNIFVHQVQEGGALCGTSSASSIYIVMNTRGMVDGKAFTAVIYAAGTFSFTGTDGARKTVARYALDPGTAMQLRGIR